MTFKKGDTQDRFDFQVKDAGARGHKYFMDAAWIDIQKQGSAMAFVYGRDIEVKYTLFTYNGDHMEITKELNYGYFEGGTGEFMPSNDLTKGWSPDA